MMRSTDAHRILVVAAVLLAVMATGSAVEAKRGDPPPEVTHDGLHLVPGTEVAAAWVKPEADLSGYERVMLLDAYVAFNKNWERRAKTTRVSRVTNRDIERMKTEMADLFREVFVEELGREDGYPVVDAADTDVLLLRPAIIDLEVTAPDVDSAARTYNFAASAGAGTLLLELYDSVSGEILARALDRRVAGQTAFIQWTDRLSNRAAAREVLAEWAGLLRRRLDDLHGQETD